MIPHNKSGPGLSLQILIEPCNSLNKSLLLRPFLVLITQIGAHSEAVRYATEQVDLPGLTGLDEGFFGFVAELGGED